MAILVPDSLKASRPDGAAAMAANVDVLTTPFDIHSTLTDLLGIGDLRNRYRVPGADMERGRTLLQVVSVVSTTTLYELVVISFIVVYLSKKERRMINHLFQIQVRNTIKMILIII